MTHTSYIGRVDGLGNRLEEIIHLGAIAHERNVTLSYYWNNNNTRPDRRYPLMVSHPWINIHDTKVHHGVSLNLFNKYNKLAPWQSVSSTSIQESATKLIFNFADSTQCIKSCVLGVHIRGTDRINSIPTTTNEHYMGFNEFERIFNESITLTQSLAKHKNIFVCGDASVTKKRFIEAIEKEVNVITLEPVLEVPTTYTDFRALSLCPIILQVSKFSSFALMAALVGGSKLASYTKLSETILKRYPVDVFNL
jgi:hypothetical protein